MNLKLAAAASLAAITLTGCLKAPEPSPFDPRSLSSDQRNPSQRLVANERPAMPTTLGSAPRRPAGSATTAPVVPPSFDANAPITRLSLREIVQRAVANNSDVRVASYDPAIEGTRVIEQQAAFDPAVFSNLRYDRRDVRTGGTLISDPSNPFGGTSTIFNDASDVYTLEGGVRQNLESGGRAELKYSTAYTDLDPRRTVINPYWENNLQLEITQPLLRNLGGDVNRANITIAKNNQRISVLEFRRTLEEQIATIEQTYWALVQAVKEVEIQEELLGRTTRMTDILQARINQDVTIVQVSQARASEEIRRSALVRARARVGDLSDQLKRLMNDPSLPVASATVVLPSTPAIEDSVRFNLQEQIDTGLENRFELGQQMIRIDSANTAQKVAKNGLLPQLNLRGAAGFQGLDESFGEAFDRQTDFNHFNWSLGFEFEIPIGNRAARAIYQRSLLQRQQAIEQYRVLIEQVSLDVKQAAREVETSWNEIVTSRQARLAADQALNAIQQREDAKEPLTPTFVQLKLDTQERLATARISEAQAVSNYNNAIARLERAKGTLLRYSNVMMEEDRMPFGMKK